MISHRHISLFAFVVLSFASVFSQAASSQTIDNDVALALPADRSQMNTNTVRIITGASHTVHLKLIEDIANVLDDGSQLRVIPMIGKGAVQNIFDLLYLDNTEMGVTQADILNYLKQKPQLGKGIDRKLRYVTKLFNEEIHLVAASDIEDIRALSGRKVNFGEAGSGTQLTASLIFSALDIDVVPVNLEPTAALAAIKRGELAASLVIAGKPAPIFDILRVGQGLKLIEIPYEAGLEDDYLPTVLTHEDYPNLIGEGQSVDTIAVPAVLTVFNWQSGSDQYRRVTKLVTAFFEKFAEFRKVPRHPKWKEVNLIAPLKGWTRFAPAQKWLEVKLGPAAARARKAAPAQAAATREKLADYVRAQTNGNTAVGEAAQNELFEEFLKWRRQQQDASPAQQVTQPAAPTPQERPPSPPSAGKETPRLW